MSEQQPFASTSALVDHVMEVLEEQLWFKERYIHVEASCSGLHPQSQYAQSESQYIHVRGGGESPVTMRVSDHASYREPHHAVLLRNALPLIERAIQGFVAECAALTPYDEAVDEARLEAEWKAEADAAIASCSPEGLAGDVQLALERQVEEEDSVGDATPPPTAQDIMVFLGGFEDGEHEIYGALEHLATLNGYLRTHSHRFDAGDADTFELRDKLNWTVTYYTNRYAAEDDSDRSTTWFLQPWQNINEYTCQDFIGDLIAQWNECSGT